METIRGKETRIEPSTIRSNYRLVVEWVERLLLKR